MVTVSTEQVRRTTDQDQLVFLIKGGGKVI